MTPVLTANDTTIDSGADDQAVKQELGSVPSHRGVVVKLAVPLAEAASFTAVTQQVPLNFSPTLVLISTNDHRRVMS